MTVNKSALGLGGELSAVLYRGGVRKAPLLWKLRNTLKWDFIKGWIANELVAPFANHWGIVTLKSTLTVTKITAGGMRTEFGVVSRRLVTTAFVEYMVDEMIAETTAWGDFKFHDSGIGVTGANVGDTDIETTDGESRVAGTQVEGATGEIYKSVGTITYTSTKAITEHGLMNIITAGILLDRHTFSAINVENTDSIEFTYELTVDDGG